MPKKITTFLQWDAPEFRHYPKNAAWYITMFILAALVVGYQAYHRDWFGGISLGVIALFVYFYSKQKPKIITIRISDAGIHINEFFVPYSHIRHFWIVDNSKHKALNIETTAYINHILTIELEDQDPDEVRAILQEELPENSEMEETLAQRISHRFKF
jgi:hypothetical protein